MMSDVRCLDAGSAVCPCVLADGGCPVCPPLNGGQCDCDWCGVCVLEAVNASPKSARNPRLLTRVRGTMQIADGLTLVHVNWPQAALPRGISYCLVCDAVGERAVPVLDASAGADAALLILIQGESPVVGEELELRGPFSPN